MTDDFLKDLDDLDPAFDYWLAIQRVSYREQLLRKLAGLAAVAPNAEQGQRIAVAIRNLDPTNEEACRTLMQYYASRGDVTAALRIYSELWELLDGEFDMEPAEETQALVARIKLTGGVSGLAEKEPAPFAGAPPESGHILILVEPFQNEGLDDVHMRRVAGLRHELIAALTRFRDWSVREAGSDVDEGALAGHKAYVLSAAAFAENDEVFVSLMLRRQADRTYLWSQRVSIQLTEWLATKLHIIRRIATSLEVHISAERLARTANLPDRNLDVYDRWLEGQRADLPLAARGRDPGRGDLPLHPRRHAGLRPRLRRRGADPQYPPPHLSGRDARQGAGGGGARARQGRRAARSAGVRARSSAWPGRIS